MDVHNVDISEFSVINYYEIAILLSSYCENYAIVSIPHIVILYALWSIVKRIGNLLLL